jgi:NAD(P)-dependent dehydrogenase (short-subunit alcohol dehydrogenase family)
MSADDGQVAVVTGANRGIGLEVARQLAEHGFDTVLTAREMGKALRGAERLEAQGVQVRPMELDVRFDASVDRFAEALEEKLGRLDVLVNNAGIQEQPRRPASAADSRAIHETLETNLIGPWRMVRACVPLLRRSPHGRIVNVSSGAGSITEPGIAPPVYAVSKAGLNMLTRQVAAELAGDGILVNSVCPGWVATDMGGAGGRPVADGARSILWAALLPDDGPTGGFFRDGKPIAW